MQSSAVPQTSAHNLEIALTILCLLPEQLRILQTQSAKHRNIEKHPQKAQKAQKEKEKTHQF